jgi:acetate kinase
MKILVLNSGSSSIKFQLRETEGEKVVCKGLIERIGEPGGAIHLTAGGKKTTQQLDLPNHTLALQKLLSELANPELGVLSSLSEIKAVGHRVVHGGEDYSDSVLVDAQAIATIDRLSSLAPLHNPPNLKGIQACQEIMPGVPQVAVFDTAFHQTMPPRAYMYALPRELYEKFKVRRYGFHGTSHRFVHWRAAKFSGFEGKPSKIISAHLGNGCSITAILDGKVIDTSMGFTPVGGLVMGTRPGDMDATLPCYLHDQGIAPKDIRSMLQKKSGLLGLSNGLSNDMRTLLEEAPKNQYAALAVDIFCYRLKKYIGSYAAAMGGLDVLAFTGGIGENADEVRAKTCEGMEFLGITLDAKRNKEGSRKESLISTDAGRVKVLVIPTDEEFVIAEETVRLVTHKPSML